MHVVNQHVYAEKKTALSFNKQKYIPKKQHIPSIIYSTGRCHPYPSGWTAKPNLILNPEKQNCDRIYIQETAYFFQLYSDWYCNKTNLCFT